MYELTVIAVAKKNVNDPDYKYSTIKGLNRFMKPH